jgi:competence protein ComEA
VTVTRNQLIVYVALAFVVTLFGARYVLSGRAHAAAPAGMLVATSPSASPSAESSPVATALVVYVCGAVARPGVYHLPAGSRVTDLVDAAGGASPKADLSAVNLAGKLADGQQVIIPKHGQAPAAAAPAVAAPMAAPGVGPAGAVINLNTATATELDSLQGVGPSTAQKIIAYRTANGGFKSVDELKNVSGIGDAKFAAIKPYVTVQ